MVIGIAGVVIASAFDYFRNTSCSKKSKEVPMHKLTVLRNSVSRMLSAIASDYLAVSLLA
jgi:hypothetical protein